MALLKPANVIADYEPLTGDRLGVALCWEEVTDAAYYNVYRDLDVLRIDPPFDSKTINGKKMVCYRDTEAWFYGQALDLFYWVSAVEDLGDGQYEEGALSDAVTNLHPFALRSIELARAALGDDLQIFNDAAGKVSEQISIYNWKLAAERALSAINSTPTFTSYTFGSFPHIWGDLLVQGTLVKVLPKLILLEKAKQQKFEDQGQNWAPPELAAELKDLLKEMTEDFNSTRKEIKHNVRPSPKAVGSLRALFMSPQLMKWRHVPSGRNFFLPVILTLFSVLCPVMGGINSIGGIIC